MRLVHRADQLETQHDEHQPMEWGDVMKSVTKILREAKICARLACVRGAEYSGGASWY